MIRNILVACLFVLSLLDGDPGRAQIVDLNYGCDNPISLEERASITRSLELIDRNKAEDALQDALIIFLQKCRAGESIKNTAGWVHTVAKRQLLNSMRMGKRQQRNEQKAVNSPSDELGLRTPKLAEPSVDPELFEASRMLAERLTPEKLLALHGKYVEGLTAKALAERTKKPVSTIQGRIRDGEKELKKIIPLALPSTFESTTIPSTYFASTGGYRPADHQRHVGADGLGILIILALVFAFGLAARLCGSPSSSASPAARHTYEAQVIKQHVLEFARSS